MLPTQSVAAFRDRVPCFHWRRGIIVAHRRVALHVEERRAKRARTAEAHALNAKLCDDIVGVGVLVVAMHREPRNADGRGIHEAWSENARPGGVALLSEVVVVRAESRKQRSDPSGRHFSRHESSLRTE